ncbi:MAG: shc [Verrucomicrobiales bacterium]|nr:shc [Verrucomicrobiales bacterium]
MALALSEKNQTLADPRRERLIKSGLTWLAAHINADGGWGDTVNCRSNLSTTTLVWAAFGAWPGGAAYSSTISAAEKWLAGKLGGLDPENLAAKILERYASDRTFSVPILTLCALAGRLGPGKEAWRHIVPLPFELSVFPPACFAALRLPVVSYALPALIAVGYARHFHAPSLNPLIRTIRNAATKRALKVLESIQPLNGGFLEAIPLTSFVTMSLVASGQADHTVAARGLAFVMNSALPDGSWQIDTNLSTWLTTLSVHALGYGEVELLSESEKLGICDWLLRQQYREHHPYTNAAPGGWAWTNLPGGVPDADDTAGALLALKTLGVRKAETEEAVVAGVRWLLDLQNSDGGIPTFCRGWGNLPFDRSSADLTAHALRAWTVWMHILPKNLQLRTQAAISRAVEFLRYVQEPEGAWGPLWFGSERESGELNRVYGTSRVLLALSETGLDAQREEIAVHWLIRAQKADGGWSGGLASGPCSVEETALALEALAAALEGGRRTPDALEPAIRKGVSWLVSRIENGTWKQPSAIGFYFAKLWYHEELYPIIFTVAALGRALRVLKNKT